MTTSAPPALPSGALERMVAQCVAGSTRFGVSNAVLVWTPRTRPGAGSPAAAHYLRCGGAPHGAISPGGTDALDALATASAPHLLRLDDGGATAAASPIVQAFAEGAALYVGDLKALRTHQLRCVALAEAVIGGGRSFAAVPLWAGAGQAGVPPRPAAVLQIVLSAAHNPRRELIALVRSAAAATGLACPAAIASWEPKTPPPLVFQKAQPAAAGAEPPQLGAKEGAAVAARRAGRAAALRAAAAPPSRRQGAHTKVKGAPEAPTAAPLGPDLAGLSLQKAEGPPPPAPAASVATTEELGAPPGDLPQAKDLSEASGGDYKADGVEMEGVGSPSSLLLTESLPLSPRPGSGKGGPRLGRRPRRAAAAAKVPSQIAFEALKAHVGMDLAAAAGQLGVSTAALLKAARQHGVTRWQRPVAAGARPGRSAGPSTSQRSAAARGGDTKKNGEDGADSGFA